MKCCEHIHDYWHDEGMWHDERTTFGCSHGELLVIWTCPYCNKQNKRKFVEATV